MTKVKERKSLSRLVELNFYKRETYKGIIIITSSNIIIDGV